MLGRIAGIRFKTAPRPEDLEKIIKHLDAGAHVLSREQIVAGMKEEADITASRLQRKEKIQDKVLKSLKTK
jgi:hypothetical protein